MTFSFCLYAALPCNGHPSYCYLRVDQFTFPGSHSAGSGFNGDLTACNSAEQVSQCVFRNQNLSIYNQLNIGIRYLSIDVCILPPNCDDVYGDLSRSRLLSCQGSSTDEAFGGFKYGGRVMDILTQVEDWMRNNTREVIGIHFTRNMPPSDRPQAFADLVEMLESTWGQGASNSSTQMSTFYSRSNNSWPTLRQAIEENQRIFIFIDDEVNVNSAIKPWINPAPLLTFQPIIRNPTCISPGIIDFASNCNVSGTELVIAVGYTVAVCIENGQDMCNLILRNATQKCYGFRTVENRTVNILLVDYPERGMGQNSVFKVVQELNSMNVEQYVELPVTVTGTGTGTGTEPESTTTLDISGSGNETRTDASSATNSATNTFFSASCCAVLYILSFMSL